MATILELRCPVCGQAYSAEEVRYTCPTCGDVGTVDVLYDYVALKAQLDRDAFRNHGEQWMWRYKALLPIEADSKVPPLRVGMTPLYDASRLAESLGLKRVWVKDDGQNPTGSLKDRASAMVV